MASNTVWRIEWGNYSFALDRKTLTYDLTETQTDTVWASSLSVGWIELEDRETGKRARHDFSMAKVVSIAEKASSQGKRLLIGLDVLGIPVDLYFICSEREIELTVEASRDTRQFLVQEIGLLPGLVSAPADEASYLVLPCGDGAILKASAVAEAPVSLRIWAGDGLATMPFCGAVRVGAQNTSACALMTDSLYGVFEVTRGEHGSGIVNLRYNRDPERRRLDVRITLLPGADYIGIARAYRDKIVGERGHRTLRQKMRARPEIERIIGSAFIASSSETDAANVARFQAAVGSGKFVVLSDEKESATRLSVHRDQFAGSGWEALESFSTKIEELQSDGRVFGTRAQEGDWTALHADFWTTQSIAVRGSVPVPLSAVVYHDSVVTARRVTTAATLFLRALLHLSAPLYLESISLPEDGELSEKQRDRIQRTNAVLAPLHEWTFSSFLAEHRFLTNDYLVEEAVYTDGTRVVINRSSVNVFESDDLRLPPLGFYVRHSQMEAHDALRIGHQLFMQRRWRVIRPWDGKPRAESADVRFQLFPV